MSISLNRPHNLDRAFSGRVDMTWTDLLLVRMHFVVHAEGVLTKVRWAVSARAFLVGLENPQRLHLGDACLRPLQCASLFAVCDIIEMRRGNRCRGQWGWVPT
jgi:hypothetical protein